MLNAYLVFHHDFDLNWTTINVSLKLFALRPPKEALSNRFIRTHYPELPVRRLVKDHDVFLTLNGVMICDFIANSIAD
jgi:hypothetical protein